MGVFDVYPALHARDGCARVCSEQEDVARETFHREVFIERADCLAFRFRQLQCMPHSPESRRRSDCSEPRSAPAASDPVDLIPMQHGAAAAARGRNAFRQHFDDGLEVGCGEISIRIGRRDRS